MKEKVIDLGIQKEKGYLYFLDKDGDVSRARMVRRGTPGTTAAKQEKINACGIKRETSWLYFIDKEGGVSRAKRNMGEKSNAFTH